MPELFELYKTAKAIVNDKTEYAESKFSVDNFDDITQVWSIDDDRPIAYLNYANTTPKSYAINGILAFNKKVSVLIINTDIVDTEILDESRVQALFIGPDVKEITHDILRQGVRYLYVSSKNEYFAAENNVLYSKDYKKLIAYGGRPEEEYTIHPNTKIIMRGAFRNPVYLRVLNINKNTEIQQQNSLANVKINRKGKTTSADY